MSRLQADLADFFIYFQGKNKYCKVNGNITTVLLIKEVNRNYKNNPRVERRRIFITERACEIRSSLGQTKIKKQCKGSVKISLNILFCLEGNYRNTLFI